MPSLRDIRNRIGSVKSTRQITKAMKMVAAAKLRRAQDAILKTRPYALLLEQTLTRVAARAAAEGAATHPLLVPRPARAAEVVVITSDRGLAGGFNSNIARRVQRFLTENGEQYDRIQLATIGRKGRDFFRARKMEIRKDFAGLQVGLAHAKAEALAQEYTARYLAGEVDAVFLVYNEFKSAISQKPVVVQLLPIETPADACRHRRHRLQVRAVPGGAPRRAPPPPRGDAGVARAPRVGRLRARRPHERDGDRHQERRGDDRRPHPPVQPRAPGRRHQGAHGDRRAAPRRSSNRLSKGTHVHLDQRSERKDHPGHRPGGGRRVPARRAARDLHRAHGDEPRHRRPPGQPRRRGGAAPGREHRPLHRHGLDRRPGPRHDGEEHRREHLHAGRQGGAGPHPQRGRRAGGRARPGRATRR